MDRMNHFGVRRSRSQPRTPGDGDCALHSVLDGYNNLTTRCSMFERNEDNSENTIFGRQIVIHYLKTELSKQARRGCDDLSVAMTALQGSPEKYIEKMKKTGEFADHIFLQMLSSIIQHDLIVLFVHHDTCGQNYLRLPGGKYGTEESSDNQPIIVAYYDESRFRAGHYQAVEPLTEETILTFPYPSLSAASLPSRTASFRPSSTSTGLVTQAEKRSLSPGFETPPEKRTRLRASSTSSLEQAKQERQRRARQTTQERRRHAKRTGRQNTE